MTNTAKTTAPAEVPNQIKLKAKDIAMIEELSKNMHLKPAGVITKALELLTKAEYNARMFFDAESDRDTPTKGGKPE